MIPSELSRVERSATCLFDRDAVDAAIERMAASLQAYAEDNPIVLVVMTGGTVLAGQLLPLLNFPLQLDYVHASRYQQQLVGQQTQWRATPALSLAQRTVIVLDDILDKWITLAEVVAYCQAEGAQQVVSVALVNKLTPRAEGGLAQADIVGVNAPDQYLFGFGLDYKGYLRNAPGIYAVAEEFYR